MPKSEEVEKNCRVLGFFTVSRDLDVAEQRKGGVPLPIIP
jgi:hypothetical protein